MQNLLVLKLTWNDFAATLYLSGGTLPSFGLGWSHTVCKCAAVQYMYTVSNTEEKRVEEKLAECICPLIWSVHHNFSRDLGGMYARKWPLPVYLYFLICSLQHKHPPPPHKLSERGSGVELEKMLLNTFWLWPLLSSLPISLPRRMPCKRCAVYGDNRLFLIGLNLIRKADRMYW